MNKYLKAAIACMVLALLFWNPITRQVILFILPLGSGFDDLLFLVAVALAVLFYALHKSSEKQKEKKDEKEHIVSDSD